MVNRNYIQIGKKVLAINLVNGAPLTDLFGDHAWALSQIREGNVTFMKVARGVHRSQLGSSYRINFQRPSYVHDGQMIDVLEYKWDGQQVTLILDRPINVSKDHQPPNPYSEMRASVEQAVKTLNTYKTQLGEEMELRIKGDGKLNVIFIASFE